MITLALRYRTLYNKARPARFRSEGRGGRRRTHAKRSGGTYRALSSLARALSRSRRLSLPPPARRATRGALARAPSAPASHTRMAARTRARALSRAPAPPPPQQSSRAAAAAAAAALAPSSRTAAGTPTRAPRTAAPPPRAGPPPTSVVVAPHARGHLGGISAASRRHLGGGAQSSSHFMRAGASRSPARGLAPRAALAAQRPPSGERCEDDADGAPVHTRHARARVSRMHACVCTRAGCTFEHAVHARFPWRAPCAYMQGAHVRACRARTADKLVDGAAEVGGADEARAAADLCTCHTHAIHMRGCTRAHVHGAHVRARHARTSSRLSASRRVASLRQQSCSRRVTPYALASIISSSTCVRVGVRGWGQGWGWG